MKISIRGEGENIPVQLVWDQLKTGDEKALSKLFVYFYSDLYQYGIKIFNHPDLVKDSIQDVFSRIWEKRLTLGDASNPKAYLIASLRRKLFQNSQLQHTRFTDELLGDDEKLNFSFELSDFMEREEGSKQLQKSLNQSIQALTARQRELIFLRFYHRLKYFEIAQVMNVNEQTVRNLMQRALAKLRDKIDRELWEGIDCADGIILTLFKVFQKKIKLP